MKRAAGVGFGATGGRDKPYPYVLKSVWGRNLLRPLAHALLPYQWPSTFAPGGGDQSNTPGGGASL